MPVFKVKVKWGKEVYKNIELNTDEEPALFRAQLYALTNVLPDRQRIVCKGQTLKIDEWNITMENNVLLLLVGTSADNEVPMDIPVEKVKFIEDMTEAEYATAVELPCGLTNLGNTCYLNATIQCLKAVPELEESIVGYRPDVRSGNQAEFTQPIVLSLKTLFESMKQDCSVTPALTFYLFREAFPQFSETGENGANKQQDANECWVEMFKVLQKSLPSVETEDALRKHSSFIEQYFGIRFDVEMKCTEAKVEEEPVQRSNEELLQLSCFISQDLKYMQSGLKSKMQEQIIKRSPFLERDATYMRTSCISRLPAYLNVSFVRFQFKSKEGINAKILKDVKFPLHFDAYELCSKELQDKLMPMRSKFKVLEDSFLEEKIADNNAAVTKAPTAKKPNDPSKNIKESCCFKDDFGSNNSGYYNLTAVLTHQGRSSSSGHYVAWVRVDDTKWYKFDDDVVSPVDPDEVLRLSGGGDWHSAYILIYGPKILEYPPELAEKMNAIVE